MIGRELYPLLRRAGFDSVRVSPRMVYVDDSKFDFVEGYTKETFTVMTEDVHEAAIKSGIIEGRLFKQGLWDLYRPAETGGVFCYTFFKAHGNKKFPNNLILWTRHT
jgi:hypothetical protein